MAASAGKVAIQVHGYCHTLRAEPRLAKANQCEVTDQVQIVLPERMLVCLPVRTGVAGKLTVAVAER